MAVVVSERPIRLLYRLLVKIYFLVAKRAQQSSGI